MQNSTGAEKVKVEPELEKTAAITQDNLNNKKTNNTKIPFQCEFCKKVCNNYMQLKNHKHRCLLKPNVLLKCNDCEKEFTNRSQLIKHVRENHESSPQCFICGKVFSDKWASKKHILYVHEKMKNFECSICKKRFGTNTLKERHIKQVHEKLKNFECLLCKKKFPQAQNLSWHIKGVHERLKPYKCDTCGGNFSQSASLSHHNKTIHQQKK